jgi:pimeloyl-ACP methyl ester carboxylesterase
LVFLHGARGLWRLRRSARGLRSRPDLAMFYLDLVEETGLDRIHRIGNSLGG